MKIWLAIFHIHDRIANKWMLFKKNLFGVGTFEESEDAGEGLDASFSNPDAVAVDDIGETFHYRIAPSLHFNEVGKFCCGLARVSEHVVLGKGKWGYVDADGRLIIPYQYNEAGDFSDGIAVVKKGRYHYFIEKNGEAAIDVAYDEADAFQEGFARVKIGIREGFIDFEGDMQALPYDTIHGFSEGLALVCDGIKWIYIDQTMKPVLKIEYAEAQPFSEGLAAVAVDTEVGQRWGYIDINGNEVIKPQFEQVSLFKEKRAAVCSNGKFGHININGEFITPPEYEETGDFSNGFAVIRDTYYGYVDTDGVERIPPMFYYAQSFSEGMAWVETVNGWGILEISA